MQNKLKVKRQVKDVVGKTNRIGIFLLLLRQKGIKHFCTGKVAMQRNSGKLKRRLSPFNVSSRDFSREFPTVDFKYQRDLQQED